MNVRGVWLSLLVVAALGNTLTPNPSPSGRGEKEYTGRAFAATTQMPAPHADLLAYIAPTSPTSESGPIEIWDASTNKSTPTGGTAGVGSTLAWSADGRLAWWSPSDQSAGAIDVWDDAHVTELSHAALQEYGSPAWSADGHLAWTESHAVDFQRIDVWDGQTILDLGEGRSPSWSRDGRLAWIGGSGGQEVHVWDGKKTQVFDDKSTVDEGPAWSDDGRLAWAVNKTNQYVIRLWDGKTDTTTAPDKVTGYALRLVWSADGRLAWTHINGKNRDILTWDGKTSTNISDSKDASDDFAVWSSDGRLAWESRSGALSDVLVSDGKTVTNVSKTPDVSDTGPTWSSDGRLAWTADAGDAPHVLLWDGQTISMPLGDTLAIAPNWSGARQVSWAAS